MSISKSTVLSAEIGGQASLSQGATMPQANSQEAWIPHTSRGWMSWRVKVSETEAILYVAGQCLFPAAGYTVELRRAEKQGYSRDILLLEKTIVSPPVVVASPAPVIVSVRYQEKGTHPFTHVQIVTDHVTVTVRDVS